MTEREEVLACLNRMAAALETLVMHTGLNAQALDELVGKLRAAPRPKRKRRRSKRRVLKSAKWVTP